MKSTSSNNSEFFIELIPLDHSSSLDVDSLSQSVEIPLFDFNATGPLPVLDTSLASPDTALTPAVSKTSSIDDGAVLNSASEAMEIDNDISICSCPKCQAPVSIRNWLMVADCWACGTSIKIGSALQSETISPFPLPAGGYSPPGGWSDTPLDKEPWRKETVPALVISMIFMIVLLTLLGILMFPEDSELMITLSLTESRFVREG
ncbi:MAG: hypothetical protein VB857_00755, partial [Pirellulaceae bacterium]